MATTNLKAGIISAIVVASVVAPLVVQHQAQAKLRDRDVALGQQADQMAQINSREPAPFKVARTRHQPPRTLNRGIQGTPQAPWRSWTLAQRLAGIAQPHTSAPLSRTEMLASIQKVALARANQLKQWLEEHPSERIPELQYVPDRAWSDAAYPHTLDSDDDYRAAIGLVRANAEAPFQEMLFRALRQYGRDNNGQFPTDLSQLKPWFESPIDDAILQRYEIVPASSLVIELQPGGDWVITQKAPVNRDMDGRTAIGLTDMSVSVGGLTNLWGPAH